MAKKKAPEQKGPKKVDNPNVMGLRAIFMPGTPAWGAVSMMMVTSAPPLASTFMVISYSLKAALFRGAFCVLPDSQRDKRPPEAFPRRGEGFGAVLPQTESKD